MESEIIFIVEESPEGGYEARTLGHSIYTQADTIGELKLMVQDAVRCHFDGEAVHISSVPIPPSLASGSQSCVP